MEESNIVESKQQNEGISESGNLDLNLNNLLLDVPNTMENNSLIEPLSLNNEEAVSNFKNIENILGPEEVCKNNTKITDESSISKLKEDKNDESDFKRTKKRVIFDSDSDEGQSESSCNLSNNVNETFKSSNDNAVVKLNFKNKPKRINIIDSDSETENFSDFNDTNSLVNKDNLITSDELQISVANQQIQKSVLLKLCDPESSEDETTPVEEHDINLDISSKNTKRINARKKNKKDLSKEGVSEKKMTASEAMKQRQEIRSESQRMLRETQFYLPYHKPKVHSIKDFLEKRSRLSSPFTQPSQNVPPSVAIKMDIEQLEIITKKLEEREKEVQEFYKSDSESEKENEHVQDETDIVSCESNPDIPDKRVDENSPDNFYTTTMVEIQNKDSTNNQLFSENFDSNAQCGIDLQVNNSELEINESNNENLNNDEAKSSEETINCGETTVEEDSVNSIEYNFSLGDIEDDSNLTQKEVTNEDRVFEDFVKENFDTFNDEKESKQEDTSNIKKINKLELLKEIGTSTPCLSGGPDKVIDLEEGTVKTSGVAKLMQRFMKHTAKKDDVKIKVNLDVVNLTQGEIHKETVSINLDSENTPIAIIEKPGLRLKTLKNELQMQMTKRRSELWKQKNESLHINEKDNTDEKKIVSDVEEDLLDDEEEEEELTDSEASEDKQEEDIEISEKPQVKSVFIDEEAEESDIENVDDNNDNDDDDNNDNDDDNKGDRDDGNEDADDDDVYNLQDFKQNKNYEKPEVQDNVLVSKPFRRIVKGFSEDSDDEKETQIQKSYENKDTDSSDDEYISPNKPRLDKTPHKEISQSKVYTEVHTPITQLTALQGLNSGSKFLDESPISQFYFSPPSPLDENARSTVQKKLFENSFETLDTQTNLEEIAQLCSGKFSGISMSKDLETNSSKSSEPNLEVDSMQNIPNVCPENFYESPEKQIVNSDDISVETQSDKTNLNSNEVKHLDEDRLISQLLDEEEMEQFKKKFESPIADSLNYVNRYDLDTSGGKLTSDSDDEDETIRYKSTNKLKKRLTFSDDESSVDLEENNEEIDLHDDMSEDDLQDVDENHVEREVNYDSEENEVEYDEASNQNLKPNDFFEKEAELSESEWGSDDEDEKDLDRLEIEQGDADVFDENKIRNDLEKIHMRQLLDEDNREIKVLQELLLEDGELHGTGRQRQFRWRNINNMGDEEIIVNNDEAEIYLDEEDEEQWRKARYQREMYLKDKQESTSGLDEIIFEDDSQVFKMGQELIQKNLSTAATITEKPKTTSIDLEVKHPLRLMNKRGSFLSRTDKFFTKLAEFTKVTTTTSVSVQKKSKNFVFQIGINDGEPTTPKNKKRKGDDGTPSIIKKIRLSSHTNAITKL